MPKRTDISSILVIGAGPIVIGQACEFDYSGTQACKALREEGYRVILVNSNPATIMTDPDVADATYIEPITPQFVRKIIERERPDAVLPTMGGQTALNTTRALDEDGTLVEFGVKLIGANRAAIDKAEDRELFRAAMEKIGLDMPKSRTVKSLEEARATLSWVGLPAIIRPSFTLAGTGGGIAYNKEEFEEIVKGGLDASPIHEVLIDESVLGWKEYEMEVVRDHADNCIIVCSIENIDPMGVHTGDSITVAPALTLTDKEYQSMRNASIAVLREIGVDTGGSNVQFAIDPNSGRMVVIEMNPRVSRSSALASKATGFPIAKIAAKLAVGYRLDEIMNDITGVTPASFEPSIDYIVTKIPRFTFEKFPETEPLLTTAMKSVGEVMAIGRTFKESLQKALRGMETGLSGLDEIDIPDFDPEVPDQSAILAELARPTPDRLRTIAQAFRYGLSLEQIRRACLYDPWFLGQIEGIVAVETTIRRTGLPDNVEGFLRLKAMGFSDRRLGYLAGKPEAEVRARRSALGVRPVFKRIDTCAAEFEAKTPYMYSAYERGALGSPAECESRPSARRKVIILGSGPNRIGQGIEFDYCCVHASFGLKEAGYETVMVNCNPETVSTDPETSDRLYFEPLTLEDVLEIVEVERSNGTLLGVIVQLGGQTPLKLARGLEAAGVPILGTSPDAIDLAEDRDRFQQLLRKQGLKQPANDICTTEAEALAKAEAIGLPLVLRPSYVLGGRGMRIVHTLDELKSFFSAARNASEDGPVLLDRYLSDAIEVDVDVLADGTTVFVAGVMEHIEEAGIHSGDSACSLPPYSLKSETIAEIERQASALAHALRVQGLMNVQFAVKDDEIYVIEVNPRASRTVPFVAKAIGKPLAKIAARVMAGEPLLKFDLRSGGPSHVAVKEAVFPFARFPGVDLILGPEMKSTGEVMGLDRNFATAFAKSQIAAGVDLPSGGTVFISVRDRDKPAAVDVARGFVELGFTIVASSGTAAALAAAGVPVRAVNKVHEGRPHVLDMLKDGGINLLVNTTESHQAVRDSYALRRAALMAKLPYYTTTAGARAIVGALRQLQSGKLEVTPLQSYVDKAGS
ncbi:carbamoyl-phosphate synthase large subunit [Arboricoccus pini]|uniref:Carbamoyl phosphate synthase large chain n=1 Tax=Arboricoccus pini TaxID=1963835 RepID=A0A212R2L6_9PROT|nr:carbamoyl-phosphate synthase large subunit [Arboricoccus pini]SNB66230.1 carbamoyl-phosphate synthase large subunit [Arboricoccus pini]